jgi:propionyl-CoA synthetase
MNTCYNCLDRHVERGFGSQTAIIHDSPVTNTVRKISYKELLSEVYSHSKSSAVVYFI